MDTVEKMETQAQELSTKDGQSADVSRRRFLMVGTMAGLSAGFLLEPSSAFAAQHPRRNRSFIYGRSLPDEAKLDPVFNLVRSRFTPHLGDQFSVVVEGAEQIRLNLVEINDLKHPPNAGLNTRERDQELSFSLLFFGPLDPPMSQQTCVFKHHIMGEFKVLVVPVGGRDNGRYYEVVFNRSQE